MYAEGRRRHRQGATGPPEVAWRRGRLPGTGWWLHMHQPARGQPHRQRTVTLLTRTGLLEDPGQMPWGLDRDRTLVHVAEGLLRGRGDSLSRSLRSWGSTVSLWPPRCRPRRGFQREIGCKRRPCRVQCTKGRDSRLQARAGAVGEPAGESKGGGGLKGRTAQQEEYSFGSQHRPGSRPCSAAPTLEASFPVVG